MWGPLNHLQSRAPVIRSGAASIQFDCSARPMWTHGLKNHKTTWPKMQCRLLLLSKKCKYGAENANSTLSGP